jgi:hypothetical protein
LSEEENFMPSKKQLVDAEAKHWAAHGAGKPVTRVGQPESQPNHGGERARQAQLSEERRLQSLIDRQVITPEEREELELKMRGPIGSAARYRRHLRELEAATRCAPPGA